MDRIKLPILKAGDKVAMIAPARWVSHEEMAPFKNWISQLGLVCVEGKHLYGKLHQFSGTDAERAQDFIDAWSNPEIKAVFCARGGYGSMRWTHLVPEEAWKSPNPKAFVGYSDITTLHLELNRRGYETLHAPMPINLFQINEHTQSNFEYLQKTLFEGHVKMDLGNCETLNPAAFEGEIVGGNLSLLYAAMGTPEYPDTNGKILFIEDLDEYLYHIDRMLVSLKRGGVFNHLKALLVGSMHDMKDNATPFGKQVHEMIAEHCAQYGFPVIFDIPAGHGPKNYCMKLNAYTTFDGQYLEQK